MRIHGLYIIKKDGKPIFVHERLTPGIAKSESVLLVDFITAFQLFLSELGTSEFYMIELENSNIYSYNYEKNNLYFILKCECKTEFGKKVLKSVNKLFMDYISTQSKCYDELDGDKKEELRKSIEDLLRPKPNVERFMDLMKF